MSSADRAIAVPRVVSSHLRTPSRMRSYLPAPKFCPTKVQIAAPKELLVTQNTPSNLLIAVHAATITVPKSLIAA